MGESKDDSLDSDLDLEGDDDASDLDSEDEMELMNLTTGEEPKVPVTPKSKAAENGNTGDGSDDDF
jgi:hypothetical protein